MHISRNSATQIVEEISKLVKQNINLMDETDRKSTRLNSSHYQQSRMPSSA